MVPVLVLCIATFAFSAGCHLLAITGVLQPLPNAVAWGLFGSVLAGFVAAILTHPRSEYSGGSANVSLVQMLKPMPAPARIAYGALLVYGMVAGVASAPSKPGRRGVPLEQLVEHPYFLTAFLLVFATCALAASHSAVLLYKRPFGDEEP